MSHNILLIDSSPLADASVSRKFTAMVIEGLKTKHPGTTVKIRDLSKDPLPHLTGPVIGAFFTAPEKRTSLQAEAAKLSEDAVAELLWADTVVIGVPMWNFGIPSVLKAWIDHIVRAGMTFRYTETGVQGLLDPNTQVVLVSARGGIYTAGPMASLDHQENYVRDVFGFIGVKNVSVVRAEGVAIGPDAAKAAMTVAEGHVQDTLRRVA
ncbi:MAG: FMN-dependent NADH-azoreductase [Rhodomicrobium sp.]